MKKTHVVIDFTKKCLRCNVCKAIQRLDMEMPVQMFSSMARVFGDLHAECRPPDALPGE